MTSQWEVMGTLRHDGEGSVRPGQTLTEHLDQTQSRSCPWGAGSGTSFHHFPHMGGGQNLPSAAKPGPDGVGPSPRVCVPQAAGLDQTALCETR